MKALMRHGSLMACGTHDKKRTFRNLWIVRINAAARMNGLSYSRLMHGLSKAGVELDRRALAELAINEPESFTRVCETARAALG